MGRSSITLDNQTCIDPQGCTYIGTYLPTCGCKKTHNKPCLKTLVYKGTCHIRSWCCNISGFNCNPRFEVDKKARENVTLLYYIRKRTSFMGCVARLANNLDHHPYLRASPHITLSTCQWVALMETQNLSKTPAPARPCLNLSWPQTPHALIPSPFAKGKKRSRVHPCHMTRWPNDRTTTNLNLNSKWTKDGE